MRAETTVTRVDALGLHNASFSRTKLRLNSALQEGVPQQDDYRIHQPTRLIEIGALDGDIC